MTERVHIVGPYGERGTVPASEAAAVLKAGGRMATGEEIATVTLQAEYDAKSTTQKVGGMASGVLGPVAANMLAGAGVTALQPGVEAFNKGVTSPVTMGLDRVAVDQALKATSGRQAANAYAKHLEDLSRAHGTAETIGELTGFAALAAGGSAGGLARAVPGLGVSAAGGAIETAVGRGLAGLVGEGVVGKAVTSAASLGARGAVEGALYGAGQQFSEDMLGDHEVAADRIFAATGSGALYGAIGGAALGGAGSLASSGAKAAVGAVGKGIAGMVGGARRAATEGGAAASSIEGKIASSVSDWMDNAARTETQKKWAYDQAFQAMGGGMGMSPTRPIKQAMRYLPNGTTDLGEIAIRHGIIDVTGDVQSAFANGRPADMVAKASAVESHVGQRIGELTDASGARVPMSVVDGIIDSVAAPYEKIAGRGHIGKSIRKYGAELRAVLGDGEDASVQALLEQRKGLDQIAFAEAKALDPKARVQALRDVRSGVEDAIADAMDASSGKLSGELKAEYKLLKKDFMGLRMINDMLEDSASRQAKSATFGLTSVIAGAAAGGPITGLLTATATKLGKERGNAAAAVLIYRMAESGSITRTIQAMDGRLTGAARGLVGETTEGVARKVSSRNPVEAARKAERQIAELMSSPNAVAERAANVTQGLGTVAPNVAGGVARNMTRALAFLNSKLPPMRNVDPLAPNQTRSWSPTEALKFTRYVEAAEDPAGVLDDVRTGKVTPEAIETLKVLTPTLYRDLQIKTLDAIATQISTGKAVPFETRLKLGTLLDIQADPSQNPKVRAFLQANVMPAPSSTGGNMQPKGPAPRPVNLQAQHTALDRLVESGPGKR